LHLTINLKKGATSEVHKFEKSFLGKDIMGFHYIFKRGKLEPEGIYAGDTKFAASKPFVECKFGG
jgi:hypothetical protein